METEELDVARTKFVGEDIYRLIPQRYPFVMVDEFEPLAPPTSAGSPTGASCATWLSVRTDNFFMLKGRELSESGLIEHIAQSVSALYGYLAIQQGAKQPPVGMIAELRQFECKRRPNAGERISTTVTMEFSFGPMTLAHGISRIGNDILCEVNLKIFVK